MILHKSNSCSLYEVICVLEDLAGHILILILCHKAQLFRVPHLHQILTGLSIANGLNTFSSFVPRSEKGSGLKAKGFIEHEAEKSNIWAWFKQDPVQIYLGNNQKSFVHYCPMLVQFRIWTPFSPNESWWIAQSIHQYPYELQSRKVHFLHLWLQGFCKYPVNLLKILLDFPLENFLLLLSLVPLFCNFPRIVDCRQKILFSEINKYLVRLKLKS